LGDTLSVGTPSDGTVSFAKVTSNLITGATAETSIDGADSILIYDDSASALRKMTRTNFVAGVGGDNTPSFSVYNTSNTNLGSAGSVNKIKFDTELYDTDNAYNTTTGEFTVPSGEGGKYCFLMNINNYEIINNNINYVYTYIYKNGSNELFNANNHSASTGSYKVGILNTVLDLTAGDVIAFYSRIGASGTHYSEAGQAYGRISGFKLL
jgi:hypothetical protein